MLTELPPAVRELVIGHWPQADVTGMRRTGNAYFEAGHSLSTAADQYEAAAARTEDAISGFTGDGLAERNNTVVTAMRDQSAVRQSLGQQCHDVADSTVQTQHLLIVTGIVLAAQLAYDALLFFQGGGVKAATDRLAAEEAMRTTVAKFTGELGEAAAAGAARRAALHGAIHAAKIGFVSSAAISVGAQVWDMADGVRHGFDGPLLLEMVAGQHGGRGGRSPDRAGSAAADRRPGHHPRWPTHQTCGRREFGRCRGRCDRRCGRRGAFADHPPRRRSQLG
ncbi:hypothetical protein [Nocardia sp. NPDC004604]|uniref:WXG100-like domain-containing protein n=1 Tax=Nocardia sp. NPDC004604 TaxID=3157013 RepID=UPI0033A8140D